MGFPELRLDDQGLNWDPAEFPVPAVPLFAPGADPMSVMIAAITPQVGEAVTKGVAEARTREQQFAANVAAAKSAYQNTDAATQQQVQSAGDLTEPAGAAVGSAPTADSSTSQAGQLGGLLGMPMQIAGQVGQIPQQAMGMATSIPQGIALGVQSVMQQVGQASGTGAEQRDDLTVQKPEERPPADQATTTPDGASASDQPEGPREKAPIQARPVGALAERML